MNLEQLRLQADRLLAGHPHVDAESSVVMEILDACTFRRLATDTVLCSEGDPGNELFILLTGAVSVTKTDLDGHVNTIGKVTAPSLLGQMGIVDRSRRTATCTASADTEVAIMDLATFTSLVRGTGAAGVTLRRLLLSSLTHQLVEGNARLRTLLDQVSDLDLGAVPNPEALSDELTRTAGFLEGWMSTGSRNGD